MTTVRHMLRSLSLALAVQSLAVIGMAFIAIEVIAKFFGVNGFVPLNGRFFDQRMMSIPVDVNFDVGLGDRLETIETQNGTVDAATGLAPVSFGGPVGAHVDIWSPTFSERML